jgi:hypothetical protein
MSAVTDSRRLEPFQPVKEPQNSIWDVLHAWTEHGVSSISTADAVTVFSYRTEDPSTTEQFRGNPSQRTRLRENVSVDRSYRARAVAQVTRAEQPSLDEDRFRITEAIEGTIQHVYADYFIALLTNKLNPEAMHEEAEFPIAQIPPADRGLIAKGAVFYWYIGTTEKPHGQQTNSSLIRFRRLPAWENSDIEEARMRADFLRAVLPLDAADKQA